MSNNISGNKTLGGVTIRQMVLDYKEKWEDFSAARLLHFEKMVIRAVTDLSIFTLNTLEVAYLTMGNNSCIDLPNDYICYTKIGVVDAQGALWTLTLNEDILRVPVEQCGEDLSTVLRGQTPFPNVNIPWMAHFNGDQFVDNLYSVGGGFNMAYYGKPSRQDNKLCITRLSAGTSVVMEYRSTGVRMDGKTVIPREAVQAIFDWIDWQEAKMRKNSIDPQMAKQDFLESERRVKALQNRMTDYEWQDLMYSLMCQAVDR